MRVELRVEARDDQTGRCGRRAGIFKQDVSGMTRYDLKEREWTAA